MSACSSEWYTCSSSRQPAAAGDAPRTVRCDWRVPPPWAVHFSWRPARLHCPCKLWVAASGAEKGIKILKGGVVTSLEGVDGKVTCTWR